MTNDSEVEVTATTTPFQQLLQSGSVRPAAAAAVDFANINRVKLTTDTATILAEERDNS